MSATPPVVGRGGSEPVVATCATCGQVHERCSAHVSKMGAPRPCNRYPISGGRVCYNHGGAANQVKAAAQRRLNEKAAEEAVARFGLMRDVLPEDALEEELARTAGMITWLSALLSTFTVEEMAGDKSPIFDRFQTERRHFLAVAKASLDAGVAERRTRLAEAQGDLIVQLLNTVAGGLLDVLVADFGLSAVVAAEVRRERLPVLQRLALEPLARGATG